MSNRWQKLDFEFAPGLDYVVGQYDREWHLHFAKQFADSGYGLMAGYHLHVASKPAAIKAINHHRPVVPRDVLGLNRALHYVTRFELLGAGRAKEARDQVAKLWATRPATIKDDRSDYFAEVNRIAEALISKAQGEPVTRTRQEALADLDSDLVNRATYMRKRKPSRKK